MYNQDSIMCNMFITGRTTSDIPTTIHLPGSTERTQAIQTTNLASEALSSFTDSSGSGSVCSRESSCVGQATYYDTAISPSSPSACDTINNGLIENVLAISVRMMNDVDCGKTVTVTYKGISTTGTVVDKCMGCSTTDLDLSWHLFSELADPSEGRISGVEWYMN